MPKILIVEDEKQMALALKDNFEFEGYEVSLAFEGETGLKEASGGMFDLIILDVMLPIISGFEICETIRKRGVLTPVIMLTARSTDYDKVRGLDYGADDYVTKPFSLIELIARVKAVLRRGIIQHKEGEITGIVDIGILKMDFNSYTGIVGEQTVKMSHTEVEILKYLWNRKNQIVRRDEIMKQVYGIDGDITSRTIDNFIVKLRQKIEEDAADPKIIITVHGVGYKLIFN
jgi:two-component system alkaline phosphatase synthesis response regulator PhoP